MATPAAIQASWKTIAGAPVDWERVQYMINTQGVKTPGYMLPFNPEGMRRLLALDLRTATNKEVEVAVKGVSGVTVVNCTQGFWVVPYARRESPDPDVCMQARTGAKRMPHIQVGFNCERVPATRPDKPDTECSASIYYGDRGSHYGNTGTEQMFTGTMAGAAMFAASTFRAMKAAGCNTVPRFPVAPQIYNIVYMLRAPFWIFLKKMAAEHHYVFYDPVDLRRAAISTQIMSGDRDGRGGAPVRVNEKGSVTCFPSGAIIITGILLAPAMRMAAHALQMAWTCHIRTAAAAERVSKATASRVRASTPSAGPQGDA